MSELLIHSMAEFSSLILPCLDEAGAKEITEIGSEFGGMSKVLAKRASENGGTLTCIDPEPMEGFLEWKSGQDCVHHVAQPSLDALGHVDGGPDSSDNVGAADAWFIDGDHNYYTVYNDCAGSTRSSRKAIGRCSPLCMMSRGPVPGAISTMCPTGFRPAGVIRTASITA